MGTFHNKAVTNLSSTDSDSEGSLTRIKLEMRIAGAHTEQMFHRKYQILVLLHILLHGHYR